MSAQSLACQTCPVKDTAAHSALNSDERAQLAALGLRRDFQLRQTVMAAGDDNIACAALVSGALKIASIDADRQE